MKRLHIKDWDKHHESTIELSNHRRSSLEFIPCRMTSLQISAIVKPNTGRLILNTDLNPPSIVVFDGVTWVTLN